MGEDKRILNAGCGNQTYGTDRIDVVETKTTTKVHDLNKDIPYKDETFDEVYSRNVLEHLRNPGFFIDECFRVLKKGGKIYIKTDHAGFIPLYLFKNKEHNILLRGHYEREGDIDRHYMLYVPSHLKYLFNQFREVRIIFPKVKRKWWKNLVLNSLPFKLGQQHIELYARK